MGFQPMRQSLILAYLTVIFGYIPDKVWSIIFLYKTNIQKKIENKNDSRMNQNKNI